MSLSKLCLRLCVGIMLGGTYSTAVWADLAVIVNDENTVQSISDSQLKNYFLKMDRYWSSGTTITPIHRNEGSEAYESFLSRVLNQSPSEALSYWIGRKQIDGSTPPMQISEDRLVIHMVSVIKGGVGYVEFTHLTNPLPVGIRVIRTIKQ